MSANSHHKQLTAEDTALARAAAERGARALDEATDYDWAQEIEPRRLRMGSNCGCVLGQLGHDYETAARTLLGKSAIQDHQWLKDHGFFAGAIDMEYGLGELKMAWTRLIDSRTNQPQDP